DVCMYIHGLLVTWMCSVQAGRSLAQRVSIELMDRIAEHHQAPVVLLDGGCDNLLVVITFVAGRRSCDRATAGNIKKKLLILSSIQLRPPRRSSGVAHLNPNAELRKSGVLRGSHLSIRDVINNSTRDFDSQTRGHEYS